MNERGDIRFALRKAQIQNGIVDIIALPCVAVNGILPLIYIALKSYADRATLRAASEEILFTVIEHIEERPRDGFKDGGLARAVAAHNRGRAPLEGELGAFVTFDVF